MPDPRGGAQAVLLDGFAHAQSQEELVDKDRKDLIIPAAQFVSVYQDGVCLHWAEECTKVATKRKLSLFKCDAGCSPDTSPVEDIFGIFEERLGKLQGEKRATSKTEHVERFKKVMRKIQAEGILKRRWRRCPSVVGC